MGVSGVGGAGSAQDINSVNTDAKVDDAKQQAKVDQVNLEQQLNQQAQGPSSAAMSAFIAQLQSQQLQQASQQDAGSAQDPLVADKAKQISSAVMQTLQSMMPSAQTAGGNTSGDSHEQSGQAQGLGSANSAMGSADAADEKIRQAAKVAAYGDIYKLLQKMQGVRETKAALDEKITSINQALAGKKEGDMVKVPVWELDRDSGKIAFKGYKEMKYEDAVIMRDKLKDGKEALSEMSQEDMFWMQRFMEQKSQLEQMISNVMKAASEAQSGIAGNLKAS